MFEVQDDGNLKLLQERPAADDLAAVQGAVEACPTEALSVVQY